MSSQDQTAKGFSTYTGVFIPNVTMMFGVILFMRLGVVLGYLGIWQFALVISLSMALMIVTSLSIGSIVTNMRVGGGGVYYLISRSLGIEIGGACGIALVLAQLISLVLCISGFAYSFTNLVPSLSPKTVEFFSLTLLMLISLVSTKLALRTQTLIFYILLASIASVCYSSWFSDLRELPPPAPLFTNLSFWAGFAMFYPALTGIEAGMALSGNLKNPSRSLFIGNIGSLIFAATVYSLIALQLWFFYTPELLRNYPLLLIIDSKIPFLIYLGIWAATLSSALGNIVGAPKMLQMIAEDGIAPEIFSRVYGPHRDPRWSILVIYFSGIVLALFTTIDQIIPILAIICLLTYGTLNFVAGAAELIHNPSWRPKNPCPWQLSLGAAFGCLFVMFMIDIIWSFIAILLVSSLYIFLRKRDINTSFQDFRDSILFFFSRQALYRLTRSEDHSTNWLPQVIVFTRSPIQREFMIDLASAMTSRSGILTIASIMPECWDEPELLESRKSQIYEWVEENRIDCLLEVVASSDYYEGINHFIRFYGIGSLLPNTLLLAAEGFFDEDLDQLTQVIQTAQSTSKNVMLLFYEEEMPAENIHTLDIWWDPENRENFVLMLSYLLSLRKNPTWYPTQIYLRAVVPDETAKSHLTDYFYTLFKTIRIKMEPKIEVSDIGDLKEFSKETDLIFYPLPSITEFEDPKDYKTALLNLKEQIPKEKPVLAFTAYDKWDHREIYTPTTS